MLTKANIIIYLVFRKLNKFLSEKQLAVWQIDDAITRIKRMISECVDQWNLRFSESTKKKDTDKKREKSITVDLESPGAVEAHLFLFESSEGSTKGHVEPTTGSALSTKKNKSLDQGDGNINIIFYSVFLYKCRR